jgi:hypothetical protein
MSEPAKGPITVKHYQAICALALAAIVLIQMQTSFPPVLNVLTLAVGLAGVLYRLWFGPVFVLLAMTGGHVVEQWNANQIFQADFRSFRFLDVADLLLCVATLTYIAGHYRLHGLWFNIFPYDPRQREKTAPSGQARSEQSLAPAELIWLLLPLPLFAFAAEWFTLLLRQHWNLVGLPPRWRQFLAFSWLLLVTMFVAAHFFRYWRRLQMDRATAQLLLQDILWHETRGEQRRLNRWVAWRKVKHHEENEQ